MVPAPDSGVLPRSSSHELLVNTSGTSYDYMGRLEITQQLPDPGAAPLREVATRSGTDEKACGRLTYGCIVLDDRSARLNRCPRSRRGSLGLTGGRQLERQRRAGGKLARRRDVARGLARWRLARAASRLGTSRLLR